MGGDLTRNFGVKKSARLGRIANSIGSIVETGFNDCLQIGQRVVPLGS